MEASRINRDSVFTPTTEECRSIFGWQHFLEIVAREI